MTQVSNTVGSISRALRILDCFLEQPEGLSLAEIARTTGFDRATAFRALRTLEAENYVYQDPSSKRYYISLKLLGFQEAARTGLLGGGYFEPTLETLRQDLSESVSAGVLEGQYVRYVARLEQKRIISTTIHVGTRLPAHATSMGKVLLAQLTDAAVASLYGEREDLPVFTDHTIATLGELLERLVEIRADGYAVTDQELEVGLRGVSVAIRLGGEHMPMVALNVSAPAARVSPERLKSEFVPALRGVAEQLSRECVLRFSGAEEQSI